MGTTIPLCQCQWTAADFQRPEDHAKLYGKLIDELSASRKELEAAEQHIKNMSLCSYIGPMRDCPTHGESSHLAELRLRLDKTVDDYLLAQRENVEEKEALENKLATANEHCELYAAEMIEAKAAGFYSAGELYSAYKMLEHKLAQFQARIMWLMERYNFDALDGTEELTKLLSAASQQGFEEGKQAGRDELLTELSEQEPVAWQELFSGGVIKCEPDWNPHWEPTAIALIPRPLQPQTKG